MNRGRFPTICLLCFLLATVFGCSSPHPQLRADQYCFRKTLISLYEDQILDNLIRTYNYLLPVQVEYTSVKGNLTQEVKGGVSGSIHEFFRGFKFGGDGRQQNILSIDARPVVNSSAVYDEYVRFVKEDKLKVARRGQTIPSDSHVGKWFEGDFYYVPKDFADDFLLLALKTTTSQDKAKSSPISFDASIHSLGGKENYDNGRVYVFFDKPLPNDSGTMKARINGELYPYLELTFDEELKIGEPTTKFVLLVPSDIVDSMDFHEFAKALVDQVVSIILDSYRPSVDGTATLVEELKALRDAVDNQTNIIQSSSGNSSMF
ncbi:MAG: hypothetical protein KC964_06975 [Candidatus Omnitrophica bacterium]|nr:hypothetical protein [Candidatus Omnitrophota bacterium]